MKKMKLLLTALCAVALVASITTVPALAYWDNDREVLYYNYSLEPGQLIGSNLESKMKRLYDRQWVVSVASRANNRYAITYGMIRPIATMWNNALVSRTTSQAGTGNFGGTYRDTSSIGTYLTLGAHIDVNDLNRGVRTNGQWSTDAPW